MENMIIIWTENIRLQNERHFVENKVIMQRVSKMQ